MSNITCRALLATFLTLPWAAPALAQSDPAPGQDQSISRKGIYVVGRVGGTVGAEGKLDIGSSVFSKDAKYKAEITGEIGEGYDFGMFWLEQTIGYSDLKLNQRKADADGFSSKGPVVCCTIAA